MTTVVCFPENRNELISCRGVDLLREKLTLHQINAIRPVLGINNQHRLHETGEGLVAPSPAGMHYGSGRCPFRSQLDLRAKNNLKSLQLGATFRPVVKYGQFRCGSSKQIRLVNEMPIFFRNVNPGPNVRWGKIMMRLG